MAHDRAAFFELHTAEDYLDYFSIPYDETVLRTCRIPLLRRLGACLGAEIETDADWNRQIQVYRTQLSEIYQEFAAGRRNSTLPFRIAPNDGTALHGRSRCETCAAVAAQNDWAEGQTPERRLPVNFSRSLNCHMSR